MNLKNKNVLVFGMGDSGRSAINLLRKHHAHISFYDDDIKFLGSVGFEKNPASKKWDLVVVSPGVKVSGNQILADLKQNALVISELDLAYLFCKGKIVAVTGTNGKTTVSMLAHKIFKFAGFETLLCGNIGLPFSAVCEEATKNTIVVCEVSSFQLETSRFFRAKTRCLLNIQPDHLDRHGSFEEYAKIKGKIAERMRRKDVLIVNLDDENAKKIVGKNELYFSKNKLKKGVFLKDEKTKKMAHDRHKNHINLRKRYANYMGGDNIFGNENDLKNAVDYSQKIIYFNKKPIMPVREVPLLGEKNLENVLASVAIAESFAVPPSVVREAVKSFSPATHRMQNIGCLDGVTYIDDSKATNVASTIACVEAFSGKSIILLLGGLGKDTGYDELFDKGFEIKKVVCFGSDRGSIEQCAKKYDYVVKSFVHFCEAVDFCVSVAERGDYVLLSPACASFDEFSSYAERGEVFQNQILKKRGMSEKV